MRITDEMLFQAAPEAAERWLSALPGREECGHGFSLTFQTAMEPLLRRRRRSWKTLALLAAVIAALSALLVSSVSAGRRDDFQIYTEQGDGYVSYLLRPRDDLAERAFHAMSPGWLPEGFTLASSHTGENARNSLYEDGQGRCFSLVQQAREYTGFLPGNYRAEDVELGGTDAVFISGEDGDKRILLWASGAYAFSLHSFDLDFDTMSRIAASIKW